MIGLKCGTFHRENKKPYVESGRFLKMTTEPLEVDNVQFIHNHLISKLVNQFPVSLIYYLLYLMCSLIFQIIPLL
jgi:hypothetical protein